MSARPPASLEGRRHGGPPPRSGRRVSSGGKLPRVAHTSATDLERHLNSDQVAAVTHGDGPQLVLAGAGSGKTRVITYRISWLVEERGVDPGHIAA
ncbi:MAG: UvrD-helicase domain-containing protein, partial [Acidobacteria bacterium]|nr:UvrD-helicase domain-containing protein [Acidobacteriota bacterium]